MSEKKFSYYQYRKELGYQIFIRFEEAEFEQQFVEHLALMGFDPISRDEVKDLELTPRKTRILRVISANAKINQKILSPQLGDSRYANEQVSQVGAYSVYCYQNVALMIYGQDSLMWELGVRDTTNAKALRAIFSRYLSFALQDQHVMGFWGVPIDEGFVVRSAGDANFESIFVDLNRKLILTYEGHRELDASCSILRLSAYRTSDMRRLSSEELLSFLAMRTCFISAVGMQRHMRADIWDLVQIVSGYEYPEINFQPRAGRAA